MPKRTATRVYAELTRLFGKDTGVHINGVIQCNSGHLQIKLIAGGTPLIFVVSKTPGNNITLEQSVKKYVKQQSRIKGFKIDLSG